METLKEALVVDDFEITVRNGVSTAPKTAYTVFTVYTAYTSFTVACVRPHISLYGSLALWASEKKRRE